jgi:hypothetical protein
LSILDKVKERTGVVARVKLEEILGLIEIQIS